MPYRSLLKKLLEQVEGAVGAGFADYEGETVQLLGQFADFEHRVHIACQGILLQQIKKAHQSHLPPPAVVFCKYQFGTLLIKPVKDGYYLVLTLAHPKQTARAIRCLEDAARVLEQDI
jgi:hypothetical protein